MEGLARYDPLVEDRAAFRAACERPLPTVVRVNPIESEPARAVRALEAEGVDVRRRDWHDGLLELDTDSPGTTWPYVHGWIHGQEEVSALPPVVLDPDSGEVVLDCCAAPGSKATQLAGLMDDHGLLVANDDSLGRLSALRANADRLGVTCAAVTNRDGRTLSLDGVVPAREDTDGEPRVDRALVDAPCTCEGTIRKNPDVLEGVTGGFRDQLTDTQVALLRRAVELTGPGGTVVYATCTFAPEENEGVLDRVLADGDCRVEAFDVPLESRPGVTEWQGTSYDPAVERARRFYPHHNDTGGFFCAKLRVADAEGPG